MKHLLLPLLILALISCQNAGDKEAMRKQARIAAFQSFKTYFSPIVTDTSAKFACASLSFGPGTASATTLSDSLIQAAIDSPLLKKTLYDPSFTYYPLGSFPYTDVLVAYLIGAYADSGKNVTYMYLYNLEEEDFVTAHSLNYLLSGGDFFTQREAWLYDLNQDQVRDLVYNLSFRYEGGSSENNLVFSDSLHTEVWNGKGFSDYEVPDRNALRTELALQPVTSETEEDKQAPLDEFF